MSAADKSEDSKPKVLKTWDCEECGSRNPRKAEVCLFCSDDDENLEASDEDESTSTKHFSTKQAILEQLHRERFGIIGEEIFNRVKDRLTSRDAWSISKSPDQFEEKEIDELMAKKTINPPCFNTIKLPSMKGYGGVSGDKFERPLFDHAENLRKIILPLSSAIIALESSNVFLSLEILHALESKMIEDLQKINYKRWVAKLPDKDLREAALLPRHSAAHNDEAAKNLKRLQKLQKSLKGRNNTSKNNRRPTRDKVTDEQPKVSPKNADPAGSPISKGNKVSGRGGKIKK
jgi:ribosomal protein L40E